MSDRRTAQGYRDAPTRTVTAAGAVFAYRELGRPASVPLVILTHLGANLDSWDPRVVDGLAQDRRVIDRLILVGSGPAGGPGLVDMTRVTIASVLRAVVTFNDPRTLLFFTRTPVGKSAARRYLARLKERTAGRDKAVTAGVYRAQLTAVHQWGGQVPTNLSQLTGPVLIVHGDSDRMVPPANATVLARQLSAASVTVFPDSGHGVAFQNHRAFVDAAREHLRR
jgi:pimeloyl-ACP methyl ester carboxylesterase